MSEQLSLFRAPAPAPATAAFDGLCTGPYAHIRVQFPPRLQKSWRARWKHGGGVILHVPRALEHAPCRVKQSVLEWADLASRRGRRNAAQRLRLRECEHAVHEFLGAWLRDAPDHGEAGTLKRRALAANRRRLARLNSRGRHHDLERIFARINEEYFGGRLDARITWSSRTGGLSTHSVQFDGEGRSYHLLTISRGYDMPDVSEDIVGGVVYHECLHAVHPPRLEGGRRIVHSREFRRAERRYRHYQAWMHWHRTELPRKLGQLRRGAAASKAGGSMRRGLPAALRRYLRTRNDAR